MCWLNEYFFEGVVQDHLGVTGSQFHLARRTIPVQNCEHFHG
jgi:hypothetical protein